MKVHAKRIRVPKPCPHCGRTLNEGEQVVYIAPAEPYHPDCLVARLQRRRREFCGRIANAIRQTHRHQAAIAAEAVAVPGGRPTSEGDGHASRPAP